jgi:hypothetical protein
MLLGHEGAKSPSVSDLQADLGRLQSGEPSHYGLDANTIQALLSLDPFVSRGPNAVLPADRFVPLETYQPNVGNSGTGDQYRWAKSITSSDMQAHDDSLIEVRDSGQGC